ncbi:MAG: hypothetical protein JXB04_00600 [Kiritimatiellae bacterium]|nr:hypothetical protein [Kiritimatiellia bacterium]
MTVARAIAYSRHDPSAFVLVASNLLTLVVAVIQRWDLGEVMLIYWSQSVIIGIFNFLKMLSLKEFSTAGMKINDRSVEPTPGVKRQTAWFFLVHYGFFHFGYFVFLATSLKPANLDLVPVTACIAGFAGNHLFSFVQNWTRDRAARPNIGTIMFFPYARILPMHLTIVFGLFLVKGPIGLTFFLLLKTGADLIMHAVEHSAGYAAAEKATA